MGCVVFPESTHHAAACYTTLLAMCTALSESYQVPGGTNGRGTTIHHFVSGGTRTILKKNPRRSREAFTSRASQARHGEIMATAEHYIPDSDDEMGPDTSGDEMDEIPVTLTPQEWKAKAGDLYKVCVL